MVKGQMTTVESKINSYIQQNPHLKELSREKVVSIMLEKGELTRTEVQSWYHQLERAAKKQEEKFQQPQPVQNQKTTNNSIKKLNLFDKQQSQRVEMNEITYFSRSTNQTAPANEVENPFLELSQNLKNQQTQQQTSVAVMQKPELTEEQAQNEVINTIMEDVSKSYILFQKQDNGVVTKGYDYLKNAGILGDENLSISNVEEALALEATGADNLMLARDGKLTKKEYYLQNKEHLKNMLTRRLYVKDENTGFDFLDRNRGKYSKKEFAKFLEDYIQTMVDNLQDLDSIKKIQHGLITSTPEQTEENLQKLLKNAKNQKPEATIEGQKLKINLGMPIEFATDEPITFEEVFKYERGVEFSKENVENSILKEQKLQFATSAFNKYQGFKLAADKLIDESDNPAEKINGIIDLYKTYYAGAPDEGFAENKLKELVKKSNLPIQIKEENGEIKLDLSTFQTDDEKNNALNKLLRFGIQAQNEQLTGILDGTPKDKLLAISQDNETAHNLAFGTDFNEELVQAMENDNKTAIQRYTGNTSMAGMAATVIGGILCFTPAAPFGAALMTAGNIAAVGGMVAESGLGYTEALTREEISEEELKDLTKTMIMNTGGFIVGFKAGKTSMKVFNKLIDQKLAQTFKTQITNDNRAAALKAVFTDPDNLNNFLKAAGAKIGTDFLISYAGDLAMMGVLDTKDDWQSLLQANLMGIIVGSSSDVADIGKLSMRKTPATSSGATGAQATKEATANTIPTRPQVAQKTVDDFTNKFNQYYKNKRKTDLNEAQKHFVSEVRKVIDKPDKKDLEILFQHMDYNEPEKLDFMLEIIKKRGTLKSGNLYYVDQALHSKFKDQITELSGLGFDLSTTLHLNAYENLKPEDFNDLITTLKNTPEIANKNNDLTDIIASWALCKQENLSTDLLTEILKNNTNNKKTRFSYTTTKMMLRSIKNPDDAKILVKLLNEKNELNTNYKYNATDIINILQSPEHKAKILNGIKNNVKVKKSDVTTPVKIHSEKFKTRPNENYVMKNFPENISKEEFIKDVPAGEVGKIGNKLYANDGEGNIVEIKMSENTFKRLFPQKEKFQMNQGQVGDCYLVSAFDALMNSPKGRIAMYRLFEEQGKDLLVKFKDSNVTVKFDNGKPVWLSPIGVHKDRGSVTTFIGKHQVDACDGIKILEQAFALQRNDYSMQPKTINASDNFFMTKEMMRAESGGYIYVMNSVLGRDNFEKSSFYLNNDSQTTENNLTFEEFVQTLEKNDLNMIYDIGFNFDNKEKDIIEGHAYRISSYDPETKTVGIVNPWNTGKEIKIPLYELTNMTDFVFGYKLNSDFENDYNPKSSNNGTNVKSAPNSTKEKLQPVTVENLNTTLQKLSGLKEQCAENNESLDALLAKHDNEDLEFITRIYNDLVADKNGVVKYSDNNEINTIIYNLLTSDKEKLQLTENLLNVPHAQSNEHQIDAFIMNETLLRDLNNIDKEFISEFIKMQKNSNNPAINLDNFIDFAQFSTKHGVGMLDALLKAKDTEGNYIYSASMLDRIIHTDYSYPTLYGLIEADGKIDPGITKLYNENEDIQHEILNQISENPKLTVEEFNANLDKKYQNTLDKYELKEDIFKQLLNNLKDKKVSPLILQLQARKIKTIEANYAAIEDETLKNLIKENIINDKISLDDVENIIDSYYTFNEKYARIAGRRANDIPDFREYYQYLKETNPEKARQYADAVNNPDTKIDNAEFADFVNDIKTERMRYLIKQNPENPLNNYFYNEYYLKQQDIPQDIREKCAQINEKYGTKIFLSSEYKKETLEYIDTELQEWKKASNGDAKYPALFDFSKARRAYLDDKSAYGQSTSAGYHDKYENTIAINGMSYNIVAYALRHELTHANDLKNGININPKYNLDEIMPKDENGVPIFDKCKFIDEFRRAGIPEDHISYAYNNPAEFIAVAAEGNMSKYSPEFKQMLVDFGMPEWQLNMKDLSYWDTHKIHNFDTMCEKPQDKFQITEQGKQIIKEHINAIRARALSVEDKIVKFMYDSHLGTPETMVHRAKSLTSLYDKVANYLIDNAKKLPTIKEAIDDVRDAIGVRTVLKSENYKNHPEVKALLEAGDERGAILRAAELQSEPMVKNIKQLLLKQAKGESDVKITRISNYMGEDGIPYFSERQLEEIQRFAAEHKIFDFSIVTRIDENDPHFSPDEIKAHNKKATTKIRGSGYTALQMNFETKDGDVFEWQLRGDKVNIFGEAEHVPYDLRTGKDITANNPELIPLYEPIKELLSKDNMTEDDFNEYNAYLTAHYNHLRKLELGFDSVEPELPAKFDIRLKASNLEKLHDYAEKIKKGKYTPETGLSAYNREIFADPTRPKTQILEGGIRADELDEVAPFGPFKPERGIDAADNNVHHTEAPHVDESITKLIDDYEEKLSDNNLLNLKKYLTANPDKQELVKNILKYFDEITQIKIENQKKSGAISLYSSIDENYEDLFDCLRAITPEKENYLDFYFEIGKATMKHSNMTNISYIIEHLPAQACEIGKTVIKEIPDVANDMENLLMWTGLKYVRSDIYDNMRNLVNKYPELLEKLNMESIGEKAGNGYDMSSIIEKNYQLQQQLLKEFPDQAEYINEATQYILHHEDIESVPLREELNIIQDVNNIQTTMNFDNTWMKKLSDVLISHRHNNNFDINQLKTQAALVKAFSEIKMNNGNLLDELKPNELSSMMTLLNGDYQIDINKLTQKIEKIKDVTIETEYGPQKLFGGSWDAIISLDSIINSELKDADGKYIKQPINIDRIVEITDFLNQTGYAKKSDNIRSTIENLQYSSINANNLKEASTLLSNIKFQNANGEPLQISDVLDFEDMKTMAVNVSINKETLYENIMLIKDNTQHITVDDHFDKNLLNTILLTPNRQTDSGYDLHKYIKDHILSSNNTENIPPFNIENLNEFNIYLSGLKDKNGNKIFYTQNGTTNANLNEYAETALLLSKQNDIPNSVKISFMLSHYSKSKELCLEGIQLYKDLVEHGIEDTYDIRSIIINGNDNTAKILNKIIDDPELNSSPKLIVYTLRTIKNPESIELYKKLNSIPNKSSTERQQILKMCTDKNRIDFATYMLDIDPKIDNEKLSILFAYSLNKYPKEIIGELYSAKNQILENHNILGDINRQTRNNESSNFQLDEDALKENVEILKTLDKSDVELAYQQVAATITDPTNNKASDIIKMLDLMKKNMSAKQLEHGTYYLYGKSAKEIIENIEMFNNITIKDAKGKERPIFSVLDENLINLKQEDTRKIANFLHKLNDTEIELNNQKIKLIDLIRLNHLADIAKIENLQLDKIAKAFQKHPEYAGTVDCSVIRKMNDFADFIDKKDLQLNSLTIAEKRNLLKLLIKYNADLYDQNFSKIINCDLIPNDKDSYCSIVPKIIKSLGLDTTPLTKEVKQNYYKAMDSLADPNGAFRNTNLEDPNFKLELTYPRETFISQMQEMMKDLSPAEKMKATDYFGFEFRTLPDGSFVMNGYPINVNNGAKMAEITDPQTRAVIEKMRPYVKQFSENNKIHIEGNPELAKQLNDIIKAFPEFLTTVGKVQHKTHDFTVDVHTLKVLQGVMSNPRYDALPKNDKRALQIATLMHDLTKVENHIDKTHPAYSAYDTYHLLSKMDMPESERLKIYQIIKNHDWLEQYNKKIKNPDGSYREMTDNERKYAAQNIAFELRQGNAFELASILAEADLKGVKRNGEFFNKYKDALERGNNEINSLVRNLQETAIHLPQDKIPPASEIPIDGEIVQEVEINGIKNKVIYLKPGMDLEKLGFPKGMTIEKLNLLVHALDEGEQSAIFQALGQIDSDALLSTSYVNFIKGNYHVFRTQGFILDVATDDIQAAYYRDFGSGYKKDMDTLKNEYLFNGSRHKIREYISRLIKDKLKLSDNEFISLMQEISDKSILELEQTNPEVARAMIEIFTDMEEGKRSAGRQYNEILVTRPKIQGVFFQGAQKDNGTPGKYTIDKVPEFLRKYAEENNLPIIYFGK